MSSLKIGLVKEIKIGEYRVALSPNGVFELTKLGFIVNIENNAGEQIGFTNQMYEKSGANILDKKELFQKSDILVKVKELQDSEFEYLKENQVLFSYLHLAPDLKQTKALLEKKIIGIAFETITSSNGTLPLLTPMSEVAGKLSVQQGSYFMTKPQNGCGVLLGGVPGSKKGNVLIIGGGVVGTNAAKIALGMGANVTILDKSLPRLRYLEDIFNNQLTVQYSTHQAIAENIAKSEMVIGGILIPGAKAPHLITKDMLSIMQKGSILVDVAIDQGGCFETSKPTTHIKPTYEIDGILHYCVANIPGAVAKTSSAALEAAILPYLINLAKNKVESICKSDIHYANGVNVYKGKVTHQAVAEGLGLEYTPISNLI